MKSDEILIIGQGLAGTCLAWSLRKRGVAFEIVDREGGSSRMAAGLVNPVAGKRYIPSWRVAELLPKAVKMYEETGGFLGKKFWYPLPILRLIEDEATRRLVESRLEDPTMKPWVKRMIGPMGNWAGAVELAGGGRLDSRGFLDASREFFRSQGWYRPERGADSSSDPDCEMRVWCDGASGLIRNRIGPHLCAKGEILTIRTKGWPEDKILIGGGGWLVPVGDGCFKAGATYEWDCLDEAPTEDGKQSVEEIIHRLGGTDYEIIGHDAAIRPVIRRSQPLIGPVDSGECVFNGLGSKGSMYAPGVGDALAAWLADGREIDPELDVRKFRAEEGMGNENPE
jgi:glycine oxidase